MILFPILIIRINWKHKVHRAQEAAGCKRYNNGSTTITTQTYKGNGNGENGKYENDKNENGITMITRRR